MVLRVALVAAFAIFSQPALAATVNCMFMSETAISSDGEWLKSEQDFMALMEMFGDGLKLPLENSLLGKLDTKQPFLAGEVARGKVYLMGSDMGVEGKLISVDSGTITIFDGMCEVGFG